MTRNVQILATGSYVPERIVTNAEVDALMGESTSEWLLANVGIKERHWMSPAQVTSDLIVEASKKALERAGVSASDLDLIIVSTDTPDYLSPSTSVVVQAKLGADKAGCYDVNTGERLSSRCRLNDCAMVLKVLFLASEVAPFAKTGGLAVVTGSLPKALAALGHDVRVVMPAYESVERAALDGRWALRAVPFSLSVPMAAGAIAAGAFEGQLPGSHVPVYFVAERSLLARPLLYGYDDDPYRFAFFSCAALDLVVAALGWRPDVVHVHDWHAAAAVLWLATTGQDDDRYRGITTLLTIHNLQHQGWASWNLLGQLGIVTHPLREEPYGSINLLARGIYHATKINTVSPSYAREIMTSTGGAGLDGLLRHRHADVHGILNGLDYDVWNPATDVNLARRFDLRTLDRRPANKRALQARLDLPQRDDVPLVAMVTRLDAQKGLGITGHIVHLLMNNAAGEAPVRSAGIRA